MLSRFPRNHSRVPCATDPSGCGIDGDNLIGSKLPVVECDSLCPLAVSHLLPMARTRPCNVIAIAGPRDMRVPDTVFSRDFGDRLRPDQCVKLGAAHLQHALHSWVAVGGKQLDRTGTKSLCSEPLRSTAGSDRNGFGWDRKKSSLRIDFVVSVLILTKSG
jgi:hypothetical protein